jgi:hypothetical protein
MPIEWNPWLGGYRHQIPVLSALCPQLNLLTPEKIPGVTPLPPKKFPGTPLDPVETKQNATWEIYVLRSFQIIVIKNTKLRDINSKHGDIRHAKKIRSGRLMGWSDEWDIDVLEFIRSRTLDE